MQRGPEQVVVGEGNSAQSQDSSEGRSPLMGLLERVDDVVTLAAVLALSTGGRTLGVGGEWQAGPGCWPCLLPAVSLRGGRNQRRPAVMSRWVALEPFLLGHSCEVPCPCPVGPRWWEAASSFPRMKVGGSSAPQAGAASGHEVVPRGVELPVPRVPAACAQGSGHWAHALGAAGALPTRKVAGAFSLPDTCGFGEVHRGVRSVSVSHVAWAGSARAVWCVRLAGMWELSTSCVRD